MRNFVILGCTGFIGSAISEALLQLYPNGEVKGLSSVDVDLIVDGAEQKLIPHLQKDTTLIVCCGIKKQFGDNRQNYERNLKITLNLCKVLESHPVGQVIFLSSAEVYGEDVNNRKITELTPIEPTSFYGMAMYAAERLLWKTAQVIPNRSMFILRCPLVYGVGDTSYNYGPSRFIHAALQKEKITLWGDGTELRQFIYIGDLARIVCHLSDTKHSAIVNIADGQSASFQDVLHILSRMCSRKLMVDSKPRNKRMVDQAYDNSLLKKLLPNISFTPLEKGVLDTYKAMQKMHSDEGSEPKE